MNLRKLLAWSCVLCLSAVVARGQDTNQVEKIENQLKQLQEKFEKQQQEMRENFERLLREQQAQIEALKQQISGATNAVAAMARTNQPATEQITELSDKVDRVVEAQKKVRPGEFNPGI